MALPKTGSGSFKPARSYERSPNNQGAWADAMKYRDSMMKANPLPPVPPAPLGMGDRQMRDRLIPQNPMPGMGDRQMRDRPDPFVGPQMPNRIAYPQGVPSQYDAARPPIVDLSGLNTQGPSTGSTFPGMFMQGAAGMAAGGMMTGSRMGSSVAEDASARWVQSSPYFVGPQMQNPMQAGPWDQRASEQTRRQNIMAQSPMLGSSNQAAALGGQLTAQGLQNPMSAGVTNGYNGRLVSLNDPNRLTPDQKYALAQRAAQGMNNYDPTNLGGRFGAGSALGRSAADISQNEAAGNIALRTYGENPMWVQKGASPEVQYIQNEKGNTVSNIAGGPLPYSGINALRGQTADRERGQNRRIRNELEKTRREDVKFKHMVSKGMNPMSPQAKAMFPNQVAQMNGEASSNQNPMESPFSPMAPDTVENRQLRDKIRQDNIAASPTLQSFGVSPDQAPHQFASAIASGIGSADLSPEGMQEIFNHVKTLRPEPGKDTPFNPTLMGHVGAPDMWTELWGMPEDTPPQKLAEWFGKYKAETARRNEEARRQIDSASEGRGGGFGTSGAPITAPAGTPTLDPRTWFSGS